MKKRFFVPVLLILSLFASCSGMIEQPGFVSIFLGNDDNISLKEFEQSQNNEISLVFEGRANIVDVHALRENSNEEIACTVQKIAMDENSRAAASASDDFPISSFKITPLGDFKIGENFKIRGQVDSGSNQALDFELPFMGVNNNPAELVFSALRLGPISETKTKDKPKPKPKSGFIKFVVKKSGNLFGLKLINVGNTKEADYTFSFFDVKEGDIIVYNFFLPSEGTEPEDGSLMSSKECKALENGEKGFCFWGKFEKITPKRTNAILIKEPQNGKIQDAVLFRHPKDETWEKEEVEQAALEAAEAGLWKPDGDISNAVQANITPTKKIKRISQETINHNAADWILTK